MGFLDNLFKKKEKSLINNIEKKALNGDISSQIALAQDSISGMCSLKVKYSKEEVLKWNKLAAKNGDADSQYNYGLLIFKDLTFIDDKPLASEKEDLEEAIFWVKKANEQNHSDANETINALESILHSINNSHIDDSSIDKIIITSPFEETINIQSLEGVQKYMIQIAKLNHSDLCIELSNILSAKYNLSATLIPNNKLMADLNDKICMICFQEFGKKVVLDYCNDNLREFNGFVNEIDERIVQLQLGPLLHGKKMIETLHQTLK